MEKLSVIVSILIKDDGFMSIFWGIIGFINLFWSDYYLHSKSLTEKELVAISSKFKGIDSDYITFSVFWFIFIFLIPFLTLQSPIRIWALTIYGRSFYPVIVFFTSAYAIYQDLFAIDKGVYPQGKILRYAHDDEELVRRVAKRQIISSIIIFAVCVLFFLLTSGKIQ